VIITSRIVDWSPAQLAPHCRTLLNRLGDHVLEPKETRIMHQLAVWLKNRAEHGEAEPLYRRALAIDEKSFGPGSSQHGPATLGIEM
jgi:Tetratricopeptide repeat